MRRGLSVRSANEILSGYGEPRGDPPGRLAGCARRHHHQSFAGGQRKATLPRAHPGNLRDREAREFASWHPNIVVKVPMTPDGLRALNTLVREGIRLNVTLVFSPAQALIVAKAGAYFVSPFLGRLDDVAQDGLGLLHEILTIY